MSAVPEVQKDTKALLEGHTIKEVRYATNDEMEAQGFEPDFRRPVILVLDTGLIVMPSSDEEGNGPGVLFGGEAGSSTHSYYLF